MTPNTGYWMPGYAYFDFLEERGWNVEELKECEDWCYPFGYMTEFAIGERSWNVYGDFFAMLGCECCGCSHAANLFSGGGVLSGDTGTFSGGGNDWLLHD